MLDSEFISIKKEMNPKGRFISCADYYNEYFTLNILDSFAY